MLTPEIVAVALLALLAVLLPAPSPAEQFPPVATWVMGFPISFEDCKARVSAAFAAEGFSGLLEFGNGWQAWNRGTGASVGCIRGNNETVVSIVTAGYDVVGAHDRLAAQIRGGLAQPTAGAGGEGGMFIVNTLSGKCIDVRGQPGTGNGDVLQIWDGELSGRGPNNTPSDQKWGVRR